MKRNFHEGDLGIKDRETFRYNADKKPRLQTHRLYVCPKDSEELRRHIAFRKYLSGDWGIRQTLLLSLAGAFFISFTRYRGDAASEGSRR